MGSVEFKMDDLQLRGNIAKLGPTINKYLTLTTDFAADDSIGPMKVNAPWTDRTTNARSGLFNKASHQGSGPIGFSEHRIVFGHSVSYGVWLETKDPNHGGRPIVMPTVIATGKAIMKQLEDLFRNMDSPDRPDISIPTAAVKSSATRTATSRQRVTGSRRPSGTGRTRRTRRS